MMCQKEIDVMSEDAYRSRTEEAEAQLEHTQIIAQVSQTLSLIDRTPVRVNRQGLHAERKLRSPPTALTVTAWTVGARAR